MTRQVQVNRDDSAGYPGLTAVHTSSPSWKSAARQEPATLGFQEEHPLAQGIGRLLRGSQPRSIDRAGVPTCSAALKMLSRTTTGTLGTLGTLGIMGILGPLRAPWGGSALGWPGIRANVDLTVWVDA